MGNGACHGEKYDKEAAQINREIENRLLKERRQGEEYKLLLLGFSFFSSLFYSFILIIFKFIFRSFIIFILFFDF